MFTKRVEVENFLSNFIAFFYLTFLRKRCLNLLKVILTETENKVVSKV